MCGEASKTLRSPESEHQLLQARRHPGWACRIHRWSRRSSSIGLCVGSVGKRFFLLQPCHPSCRQAPEGIGKHSGHPAGTAGELCRMPLLGRCSSACAGGPFVANLLARRKLTAHSPARGDFWRILFWNCCFVCSGRRVPTACNVLKP